jgi:acetylornithine aminotransferase/acetylornithine/N-succinyldiaminopimelate aminotransferase
MAGGIPIGAMLCTDEAARAFVPGMHGTTFGGNPFACAVAIAVIDEIKRSALLDHVTSTGNYFHERLLDLKAKHPSIVDVRGLGLMVGLELDSEELAKSLLAGMMDRHILLNRTHETVLRFLPPFLITRDHVDQTVAALDELLARHAASNTLHSTSLTGEPIHG